VDARVDAVLLAAGESTRMGELKALLPWEGEERLIAYQARQLLQSPVERVVVVVGHREHEVRRHLPEDERLVAVRNPDYQTGKVSSIVAGVAACDPAAHVLIVGVDQPRPAALIEQVVRSHVAAGKPITIGGYGGRRGHPVVFAPALRAELLAISEATQGLRSVLQGHPDEAQVVDTGDPLALVNLNTREDYTAARRLAGLNSST
jgi:molybdenum cofactor cytidylyltransferase